MLSHNLKEWWLIALGILGAFIMGSAYPVFSIIFGEILNILILPSNEVLAAIHPWAAGFVGIGLLTGTASFVKVCAAQCTTVFSMIRSY